jgi:hypothetical protein
MNLERCNRCCSHAGQPKEEGGKTLVVCGYCGFTQPEEVWQLFGWRSITKYPPHFPGKIYVWGEECGRKEATWDSLTLLCSEPLATHWLRVPDPTKQIDMDR